MKNCFRKWRDCENDEISVGCEPQRKRFFPYPAQRPTVYGDYGHLDIGSAAHCVGCGRTHGRCNSTRCGECEDMCVCKACGSVVPKNSGHFLDGDGFYCAECMQPCSCCGKLLPREALRSVLNRRGRTNQLCPSCEEAELANCRTCAARSCCKDLRGLLFCERSRYTQIELEEQYA